MTWCRRGADVVPTWCRRGADADRPELTRLRLGAIVAFRPDPEDPDGNAGEFLMLTDPEDDTGQEWRTDLTETGPQRLRPW